MKKIYLNRDIARLIALQRIELLGPILKKIRKLFGRYYFTKSNWKKIPQFNGKRI